MNKEREFRGLTVPLEIRTEDGDANPKVEGYASVFGQEAVIGDYFREVFVAGCFRESLKNSDDVVFLVNHDGLPLARTRAGTLKLKEDKRGLHISAELDGTDPDVARIVPKMKRGDLDKMSIAFLPTVQEWEDRENEDLPLRKITEARLFDVSIVTNPAYDKTEIGLRDLEDYRSQLGVPPYVRKLRMKMKQGLTARRT